MRIAIAGLKGHHGVALAGMEKIEGAQLVAVSDDEPGKAEAAAGWSVAAAGFTPYLDWRRMIDEQEIDVLVESGIDSERAEVVCAALQRGIHVLAEKPLAYDLEQLERVKEALAVSQAGLSMLLTMRYEPIYQTVRQIVQEGTIGKVCLASAQKSYRLGQRPLWQRNKKTFSGIIPFIGIHALDLIVWTTGLKPLEGFSYQGNTGHPQIGDMEDNAVVALELEEGAHADIRLDYCRPAQAPTHGDDRLRIAGSEGVIEALGVTQRIMLITNADQPREVEPAQCGRDMFVEFVQSVTTAREAPISAAQCIAVTEWVLKLRESADTGRPVSLCT
jgi:predicted dehydrogenase